MPHFFVNHDHQHRLKWCPHGRFLKIVTPLFGFIALVSIIAFQLFQQLQTQATNAQNAQLSEIAGTFSPMLKQSHFVGQEDEQEDIHLSLGLAPRNSVELAQYMQEFKQGNMRPLTPEQYSASFSPDASTYAAALDFLKSNGFTITRTYNHRLLIDFSGKVGLAEQIFHTTIDRYTAPNGRTFYANTTAPQLPRWLAQSLLSVNGLSDVSRWEHQPLPLKNPLLARQSVRQATSECPQKSEDALLPSEVARAYHLDDLYRMGYQGHGQTIAIFGIATFSQEDLQAYTRCFGHSHTRIEAIPIGKPTAPSGYGQLETELDAELILSTVPQLDTLKIYETRNNEADYLSQWARIVQDNIPIVSISWGQCEADASPQLIQQEHILLQSAALQGQNIFAASGDSGSNSCESSDPDSRLSTSDPDSQPFVTSVGGTSLDINRGGYESETTWNNHEYRPEGAGNMGASGGGISRYWAMPDWQKTPGVPDENESSSEPCAAQTQNSGKYCREVPDVSLNADPHMGYWAYCTVGSLCDPDQPWSVVGGTSSAAPLWASFMALVNEMSLQRYKHRVGFVTPLLYQVARDPRMYVASFHDVTTGDTDYNDENQGLYAAKPGYDMATGLGSYNAPWLANNLVALGHQKHKKH